MIEFFPATATSNKELISLLKAEHVVVSPKVEKTMLSVDRGNFCKIPYVDSPQPIGFGATISAPHMHAHALELLKDHLIDGENALDVGSGSGYLTACMGLMSGTNSIAVGIDHIPELVANSIENINKDKPELIAKGSVVMVVGDGYEGYPPFAPYNAIHVGAAAATLPAALIDQLKDGGRIVIPVGEGFDQCLEVVDKKDGKISRKKLMSVMYVPLTKKKSHQLSREIF